MAWSACGKAPPQCLAEHHLQLFFGTTHLSTSPHHTPITTTAQRPLIDPLPKTDTVCAPFRQRYQLELALISCPYVMDDSERKPAKRSRFDQTEPEPKKSRFDRRSRSPPARRSETRDRSPLPKEDGGEARKPSEDAAAAAGMNTHPSVYTVTVHEPPLTSSQRQLRPESTLNSKRAKVSSMWTFPQSSQPAPLLRRLQPRPATTAALLPRLTSTAKCMLPMATIFRTSRSTICATDTS